MMMFETSIMDEKSTEGAIVKIVKNLIKYADTNNTYKYDTCLAQDGNAIPNKNQYKTVTDRTASYDLSTVKSGSTKQKN